MTSALDLAPDLHPVAAGVREIDRILDCLQQEPVAGCSAQIPDVERVGRRLTALKLRMVAEADRSTVAADSGFSGTDAWLARQTRTTPGDAAHEVRLAGTLAESCPATRSALAQGVLSPAHAAVVTDAIGRLPSSVGPAQRDQVEADLVAKADRFDPAQLRRVARRALEAVEPDPAVVDAHEDTLVREEEQSARERSRFTFHDNDDGTVSGHFTVPALQFAMLRKALEAMTAPRRAHGRAFPVDWAARRGMAFTDLLERLPTDHLSGKTNATVVVHLRHEVLTEALVAVGIADTGDRISAGEARRLACGAGIVPAVLGGASLPLDLGRQDRLYNEAQRVALSKVHETCVADGCRRPFAWCELHHRDAWALGGRTDLDRAVPLCCHHHHQIHDPGYRHRWTPDGITFHRRT